MASGKPGAVQMETTAHHELGESSSLKEAAHGVATVSGLPVLDATEQHSTRQAHVGSKY